MGESSVLYSTIPIQIIATSLDKLLAGLLQPPVNLLLRVPRSVILQIRLIFPHPVKFWRFRFFSSQFRFVFQDYSGSSYFFWISIQTSKRSFFPRSVYFSRCVMEFCLCTQNALHMCSIDSYLRCS